MTGMGLGIVAHAGGFGWDEALIFALPVAILAVLQVLARRKAAQEAADDAGSEEGETS